MAEDSTLSYRDRLEAKNSELSAQLLHDLNEHAILTRKLKSTHKADVRLKEKNTSLRIAYSTEIMKTIRILIDIEESLIRIEVEQLNRLQNLVGKESPAILRDLIQQISESGTRLWYAYNMNIEMLVQFAGDPDFKYEGYISTYYESKFLDNPFD